MIMTSCPYLLSSVICLLTATVRLNLSTMAAWSARLVAMTSLMIIARIRRLRLREKADKRKHEKGTERAIEG